MPRTPAFVSREIGAAELCISPATWDGWVKRGMLPKPLDLRGLPRWRWRDVEAAILKAGGAPPDPPEAADEPDPRPPRYDPEKDPFVLAARSGAFRTVPPKRKKVPTK